MRWGKKGCGGHMAAGLFLFGVGSQTVHCAPGTRLSWDSLAAVLLAPGFFEEVGRHVKEDTQDFLKL